MAASNLDFFYPLATALTNSDLSSIEVALINGLFCYMDAKGECSPSLATIRKTTKMGKTTICKTIRGLAEAEWLSVRKSDSSGRAHNIYQLNLGKLNLPPEEPIKEEEQPTKQFKLVKVSVTEYYDMN